MSTRIVTRDRMLAAQAAGMTVAMLERQLGVHSSAIQKAGRRYGIRLVQPAHPHWTAVEARRYERSITCDGCGARFIPAPGDKLEKCSQCRAARVRAALAERRVAA